MAADGKFEKLKAWLIARGFQQRPRIDFEDTFSPTVKWVMFLIILAVAATKTWHIKHLDIKSAYLNGILQEEMYMLQPQGFEHQHKEPLVCILLKAIPN